MTSHRDSSLKGACLAIVVACGTESVIQKWLNVTSFPNSVVKAFHDSPGKTAWVTKALTDAAPFSNNTWVEDKVLKTVMIIYDRVHTKCALKIVLT